MCVWCVCVWCVCAVYMCIHAVRCIVKMLRISAMHLSRCVVCGQEAFWQCTCDVLSFSRGPCICVPFFSFFFFFISAHNVLSRYFVFQQCICQDVSSFGRGTCMLTWTKIQLSNFSLASVVPKDFTIYIYIYIYILIYII